MGWLAKVFVGLGIAVAFLLVFGAVFAFTAYEEAKPYIEREYPTVLLERSDDCAPCNEIAGQERFGVIEGVNQVRARFDVALEAGGGSVQLVVRDASGDIRYDRTFTAGAEASRVQDAPSWSPEEGDWTLARTYTLVRGEVALVVWGEGLPPGTL